MLSLRRPRETPQEARELAAWLVLRRLAVRSGLDASRKVTGREAAVKLRTADAVPRCSGHVSTTPEPMGSLDVARPGTRLDRRLQGPGAVPLRAIKQLIAEGAFIESELGAEYFGGPVRRGERRLARRPPDLAEKSVR